jgi:hypothetical protein
MPIKRALLAGEASEIIFIDYRFYVIYSCTVPGRPSNDIQKMSKILFGQVHRLAVMDYIARSSDGLINPTELATELGFTAQSAVQAPLRDLELANLIAALPNVGGRTYYQRMDSLVWQWVVTVVEDLATVSHTASESAKH